MGTSTDKNFGLLMSASVIGFAAAGFVLVAPFTKNTYFRVIAAVAGSIVGGFLSAQEIEKKCKQQ